MDVNASIMDGTITQVAQVVRCQLQFQLITERHDREKVIFSLSRTQVLGRLDKTTRATPK